MAAERKDRSDETYTYRVDTRSCCCGYPFLQYDDDHLICTGCMEPCVHCDCAECENLRAADEQADMSADLIND